MYNEAKNHQTEGFGYFNDEQTPKRKKVDLFDLVGEKFSNESQTLPSMQHNQPPKGLPNFSLTSFLNDAPLETGNLKAPTAFFDEVIQISDDEKQKSSPIPSTKLPEYEKEIFGSSKHLESYGNDDSPLLKKILETPMLPTSTKPSTIGFDKLEQQFQNFGKVFKKSSEKSPFANQNYFPQQQQQPPQSPIFYQKPNYPQQNGYQVFSQRQQPIYQNVYQNPYDRNLGYYSQQQQQQPIQYQNQYVQNHNGSPFKHFGNYQRDQYIPQGYETNNYSPKPGLFGKNHYLGNEKRISDDLLEFTREKNEERVEVEERKKKPQNQKKKKTKKKPQKKKNKKEDKIEEEEQNDEPEEILVLSDNFIFSNQSLEMFSETAEKMERFSQKMRNEIVSRLELNEENQQDIIEKLMSDPMIEMSLYNSIVKDKSFKGFDVYELINSSNLNLIPKKVIEKKNESDESPPRVPVKNEKKKVSVKPNFARTFNNTVIRALEKKEIEQDFYLIFDSVSSRRSQRLAHRDPVVEEKKNQTSEDEEFTLRRKPTRKRKKEKIQGDGNYEE